MFEKRVAANPQAFATLGDVNSLEVFKKVVVKCFGGEVEAKGKEMKPEIIIQKHAANAREEAKKKFGNRKESKLAGSKMFVDEYGRAEQAYKRFKEGDSGAWVILFGSFGCEQERMSVRCSF